MATIYTRYPNGDVTIPPGSATAANQVLEIAQLTAISGKLPALLGSQLSAGSLSVVFASDAPGLPVTQSGTWNINNISGTISLPTGAATEATLSSMSGKLPATLGQKAMAASMAVVLASDQSAVPISAASLPLPSGAATSALQTTINTTLGSPFQAGGSIGNTTFASTQSGLWDVSVNNFPATQPISGTVAATQSGTWTVQQGTPPWSVSQSGTWNITNISGTVSLPTGASTAAKQPALGTAGTASADVITVQGIASMTALKVDGSATTQPISGTVTANQGGTWNITNISGTVSLPTGAATETTLAAMSAKLPAALGQTTMAGSLSVAIASNQTAVPTYSSGRAFANAPARNDYSSVNVTTAAYVQLVASTTSATNMVEIFDSSGQTLAFAVGAAASEVIQFNIIPGGNGQVPLAIPAGSRVSIKAISATASSGEIDVNFYT